MLCGYFNLDTDPRTPDGIVVSDGHEAEEDGPLFFFVPLSNGDAVRVPVCQEHCDRLEEMYSKKEKRNVV